MCDRLQRRGWRVAVVILVFYLSASGTRVFAADQTRGHDIILGAKAGFSIIEGYYKSRLTGSYYAGATLMYGNAGALKYLMGECEIGYSRHPMKESAGSYLESVSINLGPMIVYPFVPNFQGYIGASAQGSYLHLHTSKTNKNVKSLKPGLVAKAGFIVPIWMGLRIRIGADYTLMYLSGRPLHGVNINAGLAYNFNPTEREEAGKVTSDPAARIDLFMAQADRALKAGDIDRAREGYQKILAINPKYEPAREKLELIFKAESDHARALKLAGEKRYFEALPLFDSAAEYLPAARQNRDAIRKQLTGEIASLEKRGIELYEKGAYRECVMVMNRILLIDPNNKTAHIYLPRAAKRLEALERLR